jgi:diacylglycerol kinase (ATP)
VEPVLHALLLHRDRSLRVQTDAMVTEAQWVIVTRTKRYAADLMLAPDADLRGTQLHVLCMKGRSPLPRLAQLTAFAAGYLRLGPSVTLVTAKQVRIDGDRQTLVQVDGEALGELLLDINTSTKKLALIFPQASFR